MTLKKYVKIDSDGYYLQDVLVDENDIHDLEGNLIDPLFYKEDFPENGFILPRYLNGVWVEGGTFDLSDNKLSLIEAAQREQERQMGLGFAINGSIASSDPGQIELLNHYAIRLAFGQPYPSGGLRFIFRNGDEVTINQTQFQNGFLAWGQRVRDLRDHYADLAQAIKAATSKAELDAIDIVNGWPEV